MGDPVSTALIVTAVASVATGVYSAHEAKQQKKEAKREADRQRSEYDKQQADLKAQQERELNQEAMITRKRTERNAISPARGTILTSPTGVSSSPTAGPKTLLGS